MSTPRLRLRDDVRLSVGHRDTTRFGSALTGTCDRLVQTICDPIAGHLARRDREPSAEESIELMTRCLGPRALGALFERPDRLREDCLYPRPELVVPTSLQVSGPAVASAPAISLPATSVPELARWIGDWSELGTAPRDPAARSLWDALAERGALTSREALRPRGGGDGITLVGHATVSIEKAGTRVLFDPFLLAPEAVDAEVRPMLASELRPHAVFVTHSHPDHYDLGSLLRLGADTPIYVPVVERESLLSVDMATRLRALGFSRVHALAWGRHVDVGPHRVEAHPFFGEQPTDGEFLHPEARNAGNVYVVDSGSSRVALVADAGRDHAGSTEELAASLRRERGPVDVVLGGYRAWRLRPIRLLGTSVARYLLSVPRDRWGSRMQLMNDADDLLETAVQWGASTVVPYANGGAPWYWSLGLGPRPGSTRDEPDFDPSDEAVEDARLRKLRNGRPAPRIQWLRPSERLLPSSPAAAVA
jgi:L-ascorbate metabolism protein UlaG (beta-lactamase superfamily)